MIRPYNLAQVEFELRKEIGLEGKNSQVYIAYDPQLDTELVIKKIPKSKMLDINEFFNEASLLHSGSHTNVVPIHYACQDNDYVYTAMPYFKNSSLKTLMAQRRLTVREVIAFGTQFLSGLHHIHSKRLIHFDVKPDNILLSDRWEAVLSDFGLAKQMAHSGLAGQDRIYGNMAPPESVKTDQFCHRFDIYQSGLTLYRMSVGDCEFYRQYNSYFENGSLNRKRYSHAIINGQFPNREYPEHIPIKLKRTINKCLEINPQDRFSSVIEIVNELADIDGSILDWKYEETHNGKKWSKIVDDKYYELIVDMNGTSVASQSTNGGKPRKIIDYSVKNITPTLIRRFFEKN